MARSWSVTPAMALTITTGRYASRLRMISPARRIAAASSTEVPPNFMTIIPWVSWRSCEISFRLQQLGVEQSRSSGAANGVVREHGELPIQQRAGAQAPDADA